MNTITIKVIARELDGQSLICKFASDETASSNPDDYNELAFQPNLMWPDAVTADDILKEIAKCGVGVCEEIKKTESLNNNSNLISVYNGLVNTSKTFNISEVGYESPIVTTQSADTASEVV